MSILNIFNKDRGKIVEAIISGFVKEVTDNWEHKFNPEEQAYIMKQVNDRFLEITKDQRNKHIEKAREIQNSIKKIESDE